MKPFLPALALLAAYSLTTPAKAADSLGLGYDWAGAYFGINAGFASNGSTFDNSVYFDNNNYNDLVNRIEGDQATLMGGVLLGYNLQAGNVVFGAEADVNYLGFSDASSTAHDYDIYSATKKTSFDASWFGTLRGRLGYTIGGLLVYGTGGLATGDMEATASVKATDMINGEYAKWNGSASTMNWGWAAGAGIEYGISNVSFGLEYLYVDLGSADWNADPTGTLQDLAGNSNANGSVDYQFSVARATAKLKL